MWLRKTFHSYAERLRSLSGTFCDAYVGGRMQEAGECSLEAGELLRAMALAVRNDQDYRDAVVAPPPECVVGAIVQPSPLSLLADYSPPFSNLQCAGVGRLGLREALNKVAHADPREGRHGFQASNEWHELLLTGSRDGVLWFAVISIPLLCEAVIAQPDRSLSG